MEDLTELFNSVQAKEKKYVKLIVSINVLLPAERVGIKLDLHSIITLHLFFSFKLVMV